MVDFQETERTKVVDQVGPGQLSTSDLTDVFIVICDRTVYRGDRRRGYLLVTTNQPVLYFILSAFEFEC